MTCAEMRDRIPEFVSGGMGGDAAERFQAHLDGCDSCADELGLVRDLRAASPAVPVGLEARLIDAVRTAAADDSEREAAILPIGGRRARHFQPPAWALGAAAILVLAVGTPLVVDRMQQAGALDPSGELTEDLPIVSLWSSDDGLMAGAPMLDGLSDEELLELLAGMEEDA